MGGCASKPKVLKAEKAPPPAAEKLEAENVEVENVKVEVEAEDKSAANELEAENVKVEVEAEDKSAAEELEAVAVAEAEDKSAAEEVKVEVKAKDEDEAEAAPQIKTDGVETKNDEPQVDLSEPAAVTPVLDETKEADKEEVVPAESKPTETIDKELTEEKKQVV